MTIQSEIEKLRKPIDNIKDLHLAGQIGIMLEQFSTDELYQLVEVGNRMFQVFHHWPLTD